MAYNDHMKDAKQQPFCQNDQRLRTCLPFENNEKEQFKKFVKSKGATISGYLRILALQAMAQETLIRSGTTQIDEAVFRSQGDAK